MLLAETFRMGGHATHDEADARATFPDALFKAWGRRDPIGVYEGYLKEEGHTANELEEVEAGVTAELERASAEAMRSRAHTPPGPAALAGVYARDRGRG